MGFCWFPGSAWEPTALQAPPVNYGRRGRASSAVRSQAEPGNEGFQNGQDLRVLARVSEVHKVNFGSQSQLPGLLVT